jgi:predicted O-methyltransferase YrrM
MKADPFSIKKYSKWHPQRLLFTVRARLVEKEAKFNFERYGLPEKILTNLPNAPEVDYQNTAVTPLQMQHLLSAVEATEHLQNTVIVEIGCFRGITTQALAKATSRQVIAVDPYIGYGGFEEDYLYFKKNTNALLNVVHARKSSGGAAKTWQYPKVSLIFIDALHDYVNTAFDIEAWSSLLVEGGMLACHDTDQKCFAGTRKAVFESSSRFSLFAHPDNLTIFYKQA